MLKGMVANHRIYRGTSQGNSLGTRSDVLYSATVSKEDGLVQGDVNPDDPAWIRFVMKAAPSTTKIYGNLMRTESAKDVVHTCLSRTTDSRYHGLLFARYFIGLTKAH